MVRVVSNSARSYGVRTTALLIVVAWNVAEIAARVAAVTVFVVALNVNVVCPAGTVTVAGSVRDVLDENRETTAPPLAAPPSNPKVILIAVPPTAVLGTSNDARLAGRMMTVVVTVIPSSEAERLAAVRLATITVFTNTLREDVCAAIFTEAAPLVTAVLRPRVTVAPLGPAKPLRVTAAAKEWPPTMDVTVGTSLDTAAFCTTRFAVALAPPFTAWIVTLVSKSTPVVFTPNTAAV